MAEYKDKTIIKCSAEANGHPPELSWQISGVEIEGKLREVSEWGHVYMYVCVFGVSNIFHQMNAWRA